MAANHPLQVHVRKPTPTMGGAPAGQTPKKEQKKTDHAAALALSSMSMALTPMRLVSLHASK